MSIEAIAKYYSADKTQTIIDDYRKLQSKLGLKSTFLGKEETEPPWWSGDVGKEVAEKDYLCTQALLASAVLNGPTNVEDFFSAIRQIKTRFKDKKPDGYDPKLAQHPFSFFRGTVLHEYLNPNSEKCVDVDWAEKIIERDVCLLDTKFGRWIAKKLGIKVKGLHLTKINSLYHTEKHPDKIYAHEFISKNKFGDLTARALTRTSKYSAYALTGLGALHAAHEIADGENAVKEISKTALKVGVTLLSVGYLGALGYKYLGAIGSLGGIGIGSAIGEAIPDKIINQAKF